CRLPPPYIVTYAVLPSAEAITSCGSCPTGALAITVRLTGSTMANVWSLFDSASSTPWAATGRTKKATIARLARRWVIFIYGGFRTKYTSRIVCQSDVNWAHEIDLARRAVIVRRRQRPNALVVVRSRHRRGPQRNRRP